MFSKTNRVLKALYGGCRTSVECASATGLTTHDCSCVLVELERSGRIQKSGRRTNYNEGSGGVCNEYSIRSKRKQVWS